MTTAQVTDPNTAELHDSALGSITAQCWMPEQPGERRGERPTCRMCRRRSLDRSIRSRLSPEQVGRVLKSQEGVRPSPVGLIDLL